MTIDPVILWGLIVVALLIATFVTFRLVTRRADVRITTTPPGDRAIAPTLLRAVPPAAIAREPEPLSAPISGSVTAAADDLARMKGVGPKLVRRLGELGITRFDEIAQWTETDVAAIDGQLGSFAGRIERDAWIEQARLLAAGDVAGFEARFGKLGGSTA